VGHAHCSAGPVHGGDGIHTVGDEGTVRYNSLGAGPLPRVQSSRGRDGSTIQTIIENGAFELAANHAEAGPPSKVPISFHAASQYNSDLPPGVHPGAGTESPGCQHARTLSLANALGEGSAPDCGTGWGVAGIGTISLSAPNNR